MIDFYNQKQQLAQIKEEIAALESAFNVGALKKEAECLDAEHLKEDFWQDTKRAQESTRRLNAVNKKLKRVEALKARYTDAAALLKLVEELDEQSEVENVKKEIIELAAHTDQMSAEAFLRGKYDACAAILTLHAGAGGTEAQDWAEMLYRMYYRYAERSEYAVKVLDRLDGEEAGIKSITFVVEGENCYGYLKAEMGVHRLVRISPFDSNKRRHTSFASLEVMPDVENDSEIIIKSDDLRVDTFHSGGAGGQNVNKTDSAVRLTHLPTGIVVQCQNERSQLQNKEQAMRMLTSKLAELKERESLAEANQMKGDVKKIEWGSQIRSYVFCPYTLVKDHRTNYEETDVGKVMDGDIEGFIYEYLKRT